MFPRISGVMRVNEHNNLINIDDDVDHGRVDCGGVVATKIQNTFFIYHQYNDK